MTLNLTGRADSLALNQIIKPHYATRSGYPTLN